MKALLYLKYRTLINSIRQLKEKPSKLITVFVYLGVIGIMIFNFGGDNSNVMNPAASDFTLQIISLVFFAITLVISTISIHSGTKRGMSIFQLADSHILFAAPIKSATILIYGMLGQLQASILSSLFLLYQIPNLRRWGTTPKQIVLLFVIWTLLIFFGSIVSAFVYAISYESEAKKRLVLTVAYAVLAFVILFYLFLVYREKSFFNALKILLSSNVLYFVPFSGWAKGFLDLFLIGFSVLRLIMTILFFVAPVLLVVAIYRIPVDFYEDAVSMVQSNHLNQDDKKMIVEAEQKKAYSKIKIRDTGIHKGIGESTIFYRQWVEYKRTHKFFITATMLLLLLILGALAVSTGKIANPPGPIVYWGISAGILLFTSFDSSTLKSFNEYQFYLLPGKPILKVLYAGLFSLLKKIADVIPAYVFACLYAGFHVLLIPLGILMSFSLILIINTAQIVVFRIFGEVRSALSVMLLFGITSLFIIPGIALFILGGIQISQLFWLNYLFIFIGIVLNSCIGFLGLYIGKRYLAEGVAK